MRVLLAAVLLASCGDDMGGWFGEPPGVEFSPASLSFEAEEGGADPAAQTVSIEVVAFDDGSWTASTTETWLSVLPASGKGDSTLQVSVAVAGLTQGDYQAHVVVDCPGTGLGPFSMGVTLTVQIVWTETYAIVDLTTGELTQAATIADLLTNDAYKTTKLVLKRIEAGTFQMGDEVGGHDADELPVHMVNITKAFYLGVFEVTQRQWFEVESTWPSNFTENPDKRPVETVSWNDCQGFLSQLSTETGETFRLPTEAEWEYACKAGTSTNYSYGDTENDAYMWHWGNSDTGSGKETHEVATKLPNPWGLYDIHGNVYEWCEDWYDSGYYQYCVDNSITDDPQGPASGTSRVLCGGSWNYFAYSSRSPDRLRYSPDGRLDFYGLRVVMTAPTGPTTGVWYVKVGGTGDGTSWANAFGHPQDAVDAASAGEEVWVAEGTYTRRGGSDTVLLTMKDGVSIYGGFAGTETSRDQRDPAAHVTTFDGETLVYHVVVGASNATVDGFTITRGNANAAFPDSTGGGMYNIDIVGLIVSDCIFSNNHSDATGGGMRNFNASPTVADCIFSDNSAGTYGGGMSNRNSSSPYIVNCTFLRNSAAMDAGGMYNREYCSPSVSDCIFEDNIAASDGGGMFNHTGCSATITRCLFVGNQAGNGGGGWGDISAVSAPILTSCAFVGNSAASGGAMYVSTTSLLQVVNCTFQGNSATVSGGALLNVDASPAFANCAFWNNSSDYGGVASHWTSSAVWTNCTFSGNTASTCGGGMYNYGSSAPTVTSAILWGNTAPSGPEIYNEAGSSCAVDYSDIEGCGGSGAGWDASVGTDGGGNIDADPLFVDAAGGDLRLKAGSPCIDAADGDAAPETDIDGKVRWDDPDTEPNTGTGAITYADMGASEYHGPTVGPFKVVDLTTGAVTDLAELADLLTNDEYKTTKLVLKRIEAGSFQMGDEVGGGEADELPVHTVNITQPFYLGVFEMTQKQWFEVQGDWPSAFTTNPDKRPVEMVSWNDCQLFLAQISTETGETFRFPTEAEWEYACKAGTSANYSYGDTEDGAYMWYSANSDTGDGTETHEVGTKLPNPWGLYDIHGNLWEWCEDWYDSNYYSSSPTDDPQGPASDTYRVVRGSAYGNPAVNCRSASRHRYTPDTRDSGFCFRAVLAP